jgi:hypothetical protein
MKFFSDWGVLRSYTTFVEVDERETHNPNCADRSPEPISTDLLMAVDRPQPNPLTSAPYSSYSQE